MKFENEQLDLVLELPDIEKVTRRQLLRYDSNTDTNPSLETFERLWLAAVSIKDIISLECDYISLDDNLDDNFGEDKRYIEALKFICLAVYTWRLGIETAEKN